MGKNQSASGLTNFIHYDSNGNITFVSGSTTLMSISSSGAITTTGVISGSAAANATSASYAANADLLDGLDSTVFTTTSSFNTTSASLYSTSASLSTASGSFNTRVTALEVTGSALSSSILSVSASSYATSGSLSTASGSFNSRVATIESKYATTGSNTFVAPQHITDTTVPTGFANTSGSIYTDGGLLVTKDSYFSSSMYIKGNLTIYGTQSIAYITSSQLNIATNLITVNTATPAVRFGGLAVYDSGSTGTGMTGSLLWDSQNNSWIYDNPSGSGNYDSAMVIMGPRNASALGSEQGLTCNYLVQGHGHHHTTSSGIFHDGITTCLPGPLAGTSATFNSYLTAVAPSGIFYGMQIYGASGGARKIFVAGQQGYSDGFTIDYNGTTFNYAFNNGCVGIGIVNPCSNLHVYCNADVWHTRFGSACGELRIGGDTASGAVIQSYTPAGVVRDLYLQRDGGKIGIGTNCALAKTHIYAGCPNGAAAPNANTLFLIDSDNHQLIEMRTCSSAYGAMQGMAFTDNGLNAFIGYKEYTCQTAGTFGEALHLAVYDYSTGDPNNGIYFGTSTTPNCGVSKPLMFIKADGKIGIGTCTPSDILDVQRNQNATTNIYFRNTDNTNASSRLYLNLIAGNASAGLAVLAGGLSCGGLYIGGVAGGCTYFQPSLGGTVSATITPNGCFGIGTSIPESTLHLKGNNGGGYAASLTLVNCNDTAGTSTGIDFGVDASTAGGGLGNAQIKVINIGGGAGSNCSDMIFTMWDGSTFNERLRIKDKRNILIDTGNNASQVNTATPSALRFNNDYSSGYTDGSLKLYLFNSGATIHGFTSGPVYDIQYHSSGDATNSRHVFYTNNTAKLSVHPNAICPSVPIISTTNNKAHTFCQLNSGNFSTKNFTFSGTTNGSFAVTDFSGIPSNAKAVQVAGWYHITGYSVGAGQGDHAMSWFGPATLNTTTQWGGPGAGWPNGDGTYVPRFHGTFVMEHDGDASGAGMTNYMNYYGSWHNGIIGVHTDGYIYYSLGAGLSGGTHYNALIATGYWI